MMLPNEVACNRENVDIPGLGKYIMIEYYNYEGEIVRVTFDKIKRPMGLKRYDSFII